MKRSPFLGIFGLLACAQWAVAQCPDGTPPPCRRATPSAAARPLDDRTWIVLPFENQARAQDIEWLRDASVNLLYLDLSKWRDIRVIDDERVADFIREVPEARGQQALGLQAGMAVARRAGARNLVMGDLLKVGSRTAIVAKVFDVRSGQRLRSVREETANPDSLMSLFGRLARGILAVEPPPGAALSASGTNSLQAYQEYVAGVRALNAWRLDTARAHFERALGLDSTFALAHYKLSMVFGWRTAFSPEHLAHAQAASRLGTALPARERGLIAGQLAQARQRWAEACDAYGSLLRADSTDVEALYNLGECNFHDPEVVALGGDTTRLAFRGSWNTALRAFRRTLELDPTYHLAFAHVPDILQPEQRGGCRPSSPGGRCDQAYAAYLVRAGDTLVTAPVSPAYGQDALARQQEEALHNGTRRANLQIALQIAREWVESGAGHPEPRARVAYAQALLRTGDTRGADSVLAQVGAGPRTLTEQVQLLAYRMEAALKLERHAEAHRLADSIYLVSDTSQGIRPLGGLVAGAFGRASRFDERVRGLFVNAPPPIFRFFAAAERVAIGVAPDSLVAIEEAITALVAADPRARAQGARAAAVLGPLYIWGLRYHPAGSVQLDTTDHDPRLRLTAFMASGDTGRAGRALQRYDSTLLATPIETPDNGGFLLSAESHLALRDSATALERLLELERRWPWQPPNYSLWPNGLAISITLWGRSWLLMADLAAAQGRNEAAIRGYRRVVGMWSEGDPEVQPAVTRARAALTRLGGS